MKQLDTPRGEKKNSKNPSRVQKSGTLGAVYFSVDVWCSWCLEDSLGGHEQAVTAPLTL